MYGSWPQNFHQNQFPAVGRFSVVPKEGFPSLWRPLAWQCPESCGCRTADVLPSWCPRSCASEWGVTGGWLVKGKVGKRWVNGWLMMVNGHPKMVGQGSSIISIARWWSEFKPLEPLLRSSRDKAFPGSTSETCLVTGGELGQAIDSRHHHDPWQFLCPKKGRI